MDSYDEICSTRKVPHFYCCIIVSDNISSNIISIEHPFLYPNIVSDIDYQNAVDL